jgi:hypothetical protein
MAITKRDFTVCKKCGCTNLDCTVCINKTGKPCYWVDIDLCSVCANETTLGAYLLKQRRWSRKTFGTSKRTKGIIEHIKKELLEVEENPEDLEEWIDVIILALDGYWRHGGLPNEIMLKLTLKQVKNFKRQYPFPISDDVPSEHIKKGK